MPDAPWIPCLHCEDYWCTIHQQHAFECPCPPIEEWTTDPYARDPTVAAAGPGPSTPDALAAVIAGPGSAIAHPVCSQRTIVAALVVDAPGGARTVMLDRPTRDAVCEALAANSLFVGLYNKTGKAPSALEFRPSWDWPEEDRAAMGLPPKHPTPPRGRKLLAAEALERPHPVPERVGLAVLDPWRKGTHRAHVRVIADAFVTHVTIGRRDGGVLAALEFNTPLKVAAGGHVTLGLRLDDLGIAPRQLPAESEAPIPARQALLREANALRKKALPPGDPLDDHDHHGPDR